MAVKDSVEQYLDENIESLNVLKRELDVIIKIAERFIDTLRRGNKVFFFGNGGSAADAQHLAAEFVGRFQMERKGLPAIALTANTSSLTSIGNDYGFEDVFRRQIEALGNKGDLAVGISTSGDAANVINGITAAKEMQLGTIVFTGKSGGSLGKLVQKGIVDIAFFAPADRTPHIQEMHITTGHIICQLVEEELFKK